MTSPGAALVSGCRFLTSVKYRIDDLMHALWQRLGTNEPVLSDPLFQRLGVGSAVLDPDGIDWLEEIGQHPALDDDLWLSERHPGWHGLECLDVPVRYAIAPYSFARLALPCRGHDITYKERRPGELSLSQVDPSLVIGGTYSRAWPVTLGDDQLDEINGRAAAAAPGTDTAYVKVGRLPLYLAMEGKNRVRAFRNAGKQITAFTRTAGFPEPEALRLHRVAGLPGAAVSGTGPGDLQVLVLASVTVPVLEAYGVPWGEPLDTSAADDRGRPLGLARRTALTDLVTHFMHP